MWKKNPRGTQVFKTQVPPFTFPMPVLLLLLHMFFSPPTCDSSSSDLHSPKRFLNLVLLLLLPLFWFFGSAFSREVFKSGASSFISGSSSSSSSFFFFYGTRVFKTQVPYGKNISMLAIKTRVFEAQFLRRTRALKAWDVILLNSSNSC